jgi:DNA-binding response OmpR family regulator
VARVPFRNAAGQPARVLVVEDELLIALEIEDILSAAGVEVIGPATTVGAALALLQHERPDAAVLDANLRGEWVVPVAQVLRSLKIPFVLASAYTAEQWEHDAPLAGATNLGKPTTAPVLLEALETMLGAKG